MREYGSQGEMLTRKDERDPNNSATHLVRNVVTPAVGCEKAMEFLDIMRNSAMPCST